MIMITWIKPHILDGQEEFISYNSDGTPSGFMVKLFEGPNYDPQEGFVDIHMRTRDLTEEEMDAIPMRCSDGSVRNITYGEWRKGQA